MNEANLTKSSLGKEIHPLFYIGIAVFAYGPIMNIFGVNAWDWLNKAGIGLILVGVALTAFNRG